MDTIILMVEMANANKIKVILCTILPSNHFYWNPKLEPANKVIALNKLILDYSQKNKISLIDYYSAMVDGENGLQKKYGPDGVHPNLEGYKVMENLISVKLNSTEFL
jgi:lysophospholipase L1-like esterase